MAEAGCAVFIVHARKAWLKGLSPKENREVPPLDYARVHRLKAARPGLTIVVNGGLTSLEEASDQLRHVDGVMLGRAAYQDPYILAGVDRDFFGAIGPIPSREDVLEELATYAAAHMARGGRLNNITRHILGLYHGQPRARRFRRHLSELAVGPEASLDVLRDAIAVVRGTGAEACEVKAA